MPALTGKTYSSIRENKNRERIGVLLKQLPISCSDFIMSIQDRTQSTTRLGYVRDLITFFEYLKKESALFADVPIVSITPDMIEVLRIEDFNRYSDYLYYHRDEEDNEHTNGELSRQRKLCALRAYYNYLFKNGKIKSDRSRLIELPKRHEKAIIRLDIDEIAKLLDAVENNTAFSDRKQKYNEHTRIRDLTILTLFLGTGIRVSELVGLNINDLNFNENSFRVIRKGGSEAILYMPYEVAEQLKEYIAIREKIGDEAIDRDALFLSLQKKRLCVRSVENLVKKYASVIAPLKPKISPHKLRSTFGTNLYNETGDIYLVADVLGHSDVNTTRRHYAAMSEEKRKTAAKIVKLRDQK